MSWTGCRRIFPAFLMTSCFLLCTGCASKTEPALILPPAILLADCDPPSEDAIRDSKNLKEYALAVTSVKLAYEEKLRLCNADKAGLRAFYEKLKSTERGE